MTARLANLAGRAVLVSEGRALDVEQRSGGRLPADPMEVLARWDEFCAFAQEERASDADAVFDAARAGPPVPRPAKVFGVGLNYRSHAEEAKLDVPDEPLIFTKFPNCICGPHAQVVLSSNRVDYEAELVAVIGRPGRNLGAAEAMEHVAGYCVGQDISDRRLQFGGKPPQFSMGKSVDTFGPTGPLLVATQAFADPDDLAIRCEVNGEARQQDRTSNMIFSVAELVVYLSRFCTLLPGDLIFTGTPAGIGGVHGIYLAEGDVIASSVEGIGSLENRCVAGA